MGPQNRLSILAPLRALRDLRGLRSICFTTKGTKETGGILRVRSVTVHTVRMENPTKAGHERHGRTRGHGSVVIEEKTS